MSARKDSSLAGPEHSWIETGSDVERLVFFSDAVFAITLLALEIRLPELHDPVTTHKLAKALVGLLPLFFVRPVTNLYARRRLG